MAPGFGVASGAGAAAGIITAIATGAIHASQHAAELPDAIDLICSRIDAPGEAKIIPGTTHEFSYGAFMQAHVHRRVHGRRLTSKLDSLPGYRLIEVHTDTLETLGIERQPAAVPGEPAA